MKTLPRIGNLQFSAVAVACAIIICGCGSSSDPRQAVHGIINGAEGRSGLISFAPMGETSGTSTRTVIEDGYYEFDRSNGPISGDFRVFIQLAPALSDEDITVSVKGIDVPVSELGNLTPDFESAVEFHAVVPASDSGSVKLDFQLPQS